MADRKREPAARDVPSRPPTIYDVAAAAGVAASTVSRAFSRPGRVNAATAERIRQVAADLGYRMNPLASALPTGRTSLLALVVSDVTNPVYAEIIRGAEAAAAEAGLVVLLLDAHESDRRERDGLERALPIVEGVILAGTRMSDSAIRMTAKQRPTVVLNRQVADVPSLVQDNALGMRLVVRHLAEHDHRALTYVAGPEASWADGMRWRRLREAAAEAGLRVQRTGPFPPTIAGGQEAATALGPEPPTAVVAYNDQVAIGLMLALQAAGHSVPEEISVVGHDNILPAQLVTPRLTTVAAPLRVQGRDAVNAVVAARAGAPSRTGPGVPLPVRLVVRDSTARRRHPLSARPARTATTDAR
ncbi:LacI family DNA-binding transcriptional regulator [Actinomadura fibrosa]|uniref:LacI family DNA-binding transcriptional regulator n=1 Tax=Actinomadura fibrosa TaxID=111802 RepID=A0ABW2XW10_9ACTN|nr:LacI family DNA-binding transcriptional regulator [Actinomadura fibrosa]